ANRLLRRVPEAFGAGAKDDAVYAGNSSRRNRRTNLRLSPFFRSGDGAFFAPATSIAPVGTKSPRTYEFCATLPRQTAPRSKRAPARRRSDQSAAGGALSFSALARSARRTSAAVAGGNSDFRSRCLALRFDSKTNRALGAIPPFGDWRIHPPIFSVVARSPR